MRSTKLVRILLTLSNKERAWFSQLVHSPYFNENPRLVQLYEIIESFVFGINSDPSREYIWDKLFPKRKYDDAILRKNLSDLAKLAEQFLLMQELKKNGGDKAGLLLKALSSRGLVKEFQQNMDVSSKNLDKIATRDVDYYLHKHILSSENNRFIWSLGKRSTDNDLLETTDSLDNFYLINKLKYCCVMLNYSNVLEVDFNLLLMEEILEHIRKNDYNHVPAIAIYYHILMLLKEEDDEIHYKRLKKLLEKHSRKFQLEELREMYTHALNFCIKKANTGQREYLYKLLDVYKSALPKGILDEGKFLSPWNYKNIVTAGLRVGETDWVKHFIEEYKVRLEKKYRDNAYTYNTARYHFHIKEYDEVIGLLQKVEYEDIYYNLSSKSMLLKIFYETDESDQLYSLLDSFEIYLRRNKLISSYHKTNYLNLVKYTRKLLRLPPKDKAKADKLRKELEAASNVSDRKWLISCIM